MRLIRSRLLLYGMLALAASAAGIVVAVGNGGGPGSDAGTVQTSDLWQPGHSWQVRVRQDGSAIRADAEKVIYTTTYSFHVVSAPQRANGDWVVNARQSGAVGIWARGYTLRYREARDGSFELHGVALGDSRPVAARHARALLGDVFPLQQTVHKRPVSYATAGIASSAPQSGQLPPPLPVS